MGDYSKLVEDMCKAATEATAVQSRIAAAAETQAEALKTMAQMACLAMMASPTISEELKLEAVRTLGGLCK